MKVLYISSSIFNEQGKSSSLASHFMDQLKERHPEAEVMHRDLAADPIPHLDAARFQAHITAKEERTDEQQTLAALGDSLVEELLQADILVLGVPMYNFGIPSTLKAWIDYVARAGTTFRYTANGPEGLIKGKKAFILGARGGAYWGTPNDTQTPYLKTFLGFIGITDVKFIVAEKLNLQPEKAPEIIADAKLRISEIVPA